MSVIYNKTRVRVFSHPGSLGEGTGEQNFATSRRGGVYIFFRLLFSSSRERIKIYMRLLLPRGALDQSKNATIARWLSSAMHVQLTQIASSRP
jgi:hypothetical protein